MPFKKGQSGNPGGRKKLSWKDELEKAIIEYGKNIDKTPFQRIAEIFFTKDSKAAVGIANFFIPKLKTVEARIDGDGPFRLIIALPEPKPKQIEQAESPSNPLIKTITSEQIEPVKAGESKDKEQ